MASIEIESRYAQIAQAAYAKDLLPEANNAARYESAGMSATQADQFDANWRVLSQTTQSNGLSAVLFQDKNTGEKVMELIRILGLAAAGLCLAACARFDLDEKMEELCKKDGGVKVYETVSLSPLEYGRIFNYVATAKSRDQYFGPEYRFELREEILVGKGARPEEGDAQLSRWYSALYRRSDNRLLGESISYTRSGGDGFNFGAHPSSNICPRADRDLGRQIFHKSN